MIESATNDIMNNLKSKLCGELQELFFKEYEYDGKSYPAWHFINSPILTVLEMQKIYNTVDTMGV